MDYKIKEYKIKELLAIVQSGKIDLSPSYQRNFIWSKKDQSSLIDTILKGYPLPSLFIYVDLNGNYEVVDGQQRTRTIFKYYSGDIKNSEGTSFKEIDASRFLDYRIPVIEISNLQEGDSLNEFYVLINKKGKPLNKPEVDKAEFSDHPFLKIADEALNYQNFIDLEIFSEATSKRMNDRAFVEELLAYLQFGITDKKQGVEQAYNLPKEDTETYISLLNTFKSVVDVIYKAQKDAPLKNTRYKQKNDFYTLFNFTYQVKDVSQEVFNYMYKVLLILNKKDDEGMQFISPSNEESIALREYAFNCVSQSNSKKARLARLSFFRDVLMNKNYENNEVLRDVLDYLTRMYGRKLVDLKDVSEFQLIDISKIL